MIEDYVFEFHVQPNQEEQINNTTHLKEKQNTTIKHEEPYNAAEHIYIDLPNICRMYSYNSAVDIL